MAYEHLKRLLEEHDEDQTDLARLLGRTAAVVTNLFNGTRSLQIEEVEKIMQRYGVSADFVLFGKEKALLRDSEIALIDAFKDIIQYLALRDPNVFGQLANAFNYQRVEYAEKELKGAVSVMEILGSFVAPEVHASEREVIRRLLQLAPAGSA